MNTCVLIAVNDIAVRNTYRRTLEASGYHVETASNGLECLSKFNRAPAILVLDCDLLWGGSDGVISHLTEKWNAPSIPVILISEYDDAKDLAELVVDPVVACLQKPFHLDTLTQCVTLAEDLLPNAVAE
jgi:DNA-binding NtrC family response regulator